MRTWIQLAIAGLATVGLVGLGAPGVQAETGSSPQTGSQRFAACLNAQKSGDLLILMDESGSLRVGSDGLPASDPDDMRVTATNALLERLAPTLADGNVDLSVSMASFGTRYDPMGADWTPLTPDTLGGLQQRADAFRDKDRALGTDYWLGLDGARRALVAKQGGTDRCQAILFFSDGALDIQPGPEDARELQPRPYAPDNRLASPRDREAATAAAADSLCRAGGLADQIRTSGIITLGIGLSVDRPDETFDLMRGIATGTGGPTSCGGHVTPTPGEFTLARSIDDMLMGMTQVLVEGPVVTTALCQGAVCPEGVHSVVLDASVSRVDIIGASDVDDAQVHLAAPDGTFVELTRGQAGQPQPIAIAGVNGSYRWLSNRTITILLDAENSLLWTGQWQFVFVDPTASSEGKQSRTSISVRGDLEPRWTPATSDAARIGTPITGTLSLVNGRGEPIDPAAILGTSLLDAAWVGPDGASTPLVTDLTKDRLGETLTLTPESEGGHLLRLVLDVTTASATSGDGSDLPGTALAPVALDVPVEVLAPFGYPVVGQKVDFGVVEDHDRVDARASLPITGPGCVWVEPGVTTVTAGPADVTNAQITSTANGRAACLRLEEGQKGDLPLQLAADQIGNGGLNGTFAVSMVPLEDGGEARTAEVAFGADLNKPLNAFNYALALVAALVLGPGIPLALLYLYKFLFASKIPARLLQGLEIPITIRDGRVQRDGGRLELTDADRTVMTSIPSGGARALSIGDHTLKAKLGASPMGPGHVVVESPGRVGASDHDRTPFGKLKQARLPLAVQNHWVVLVRPGDPENATLLALLGSGGEAEHQALLDTAAAELPGLVQRLAGETLDAQATGGVRTASSAPAGQDDPFRSPGIPIDDPFAPGGGSADDPFASLGGERASSPSQVQKRARRWGQPSRAVEPPPSDPFDFGASNPDHDDPFAR